MLKYYCCVLPLWYSQQFQKTMNHEEKKENRVYIFIITTGYSSSILSSLGYLSGEPISWRVPSSADNPMVL